VRCQVEWAPQLPSSAEAVEAAEFDFEGAQDEDGDDDLHDARIPLRSGGGGAQPDASCLGKRRR
jgi:hypothetical protein